jgi:septal ring factor EnvC (AmiA/AmiB activator)
MKKKILLTIGLTGLLATATQADQEQLAKSIRDAHVETSRTFQQLKATLGALNELTKQSKGDLRPAYNAFCSEAAKTVEAAGVTQTRLQWMGGEGRKYFSEWQNSINTIANESLRKKAQKRLTSVQKSYDEVEASLKLAAEKFKPYLSDLNDIKTALASDVTAGGVKAIRSTVSTANWDYKFVERAINSAMKEMGKMEKALTSQAT